LLECGRLIIHAALHGVAAAGPGEVVDQLRAGLDAGVVVAEVVADVGDAGDVDEGVARGGVALLHPQFLAPVDAEPELVQQRRGDDGGQLAGAAVHAVGEGQAAADNGQPPAAVVRRIIGEAAVAQKAAVARIQFEVDLAEGGMKLFAEHGRGGFRGREIERLGVGRRDRDRPGNHQRIPLVLGEEKDLVLPDRPPHSAGEVFPFLVRPGGGQAGTGVGR